MCTQKISAIQNQHTFSGTYLICLTEIRHLLMEYSSSNYFSNVLISLIILSTFKVAFVPVLVYFSRGPLYNSWSWCGLFFFALINVTKRQDYTCWIYLLFDRIQHILGFPKFDRVWELCQLTTKRQVEQLLKLFREVWIPVERKECTIHSGLPWYCVRGSLSLINLIKINYRSQTSESISIGSGLNNLRILIHICI